MAVSRDQDGDPTFGIVTMITATELQLWIRGAKRTNMLLEQFTFEYDPEIGDWVELQTLGPNMCSLTKADDSTMPTITWDGQRCLMTKINFLPLKGAYLYPASAPEKNLVLAWTDELGAIPLVFKNTFQNHCFYEGEALINMENLSSGQTLMNIENFYGTPWLIKKVEEADYTFTRDISFFDRFKYTGIVVKESCESFFAFNKDTGLVAVAKTLAQGIRLGDWIQFHCIMNSGVYGKSKILVENFLPRRIEPVYNCVVSSDDTISIDHAIEVPVNPTHMGEYEVEQLGSVQDVDGLINCKMENRAIQVKSVCIVDTEREEACFHICNVWMKLVAFTGPLSLRISKQTIKNNQEKNEIIKLVQVLKTQSFPPFQNTVKPEGIVFSTGKDFVKLYSSDPAVRNSIVTLTSKHICPLPKLGDCVELTMKGVGSHRRPEYVHIDARKVEPLYQTRIVGKNALEVRTSVNIIKSDTIYAPKFGHIGNYNQALKLTEAHEGCHCEIWIAKIENNQLHWAVSSDPDVVWQSQPQPKPVPNAAGARPCTYKFIGKQYINKTSTPSSPTPPDCSLSTEPPQPIQSSSSLGLIWTVKTRNYLQQSTQIMEATAITQLKDSTRPHHPTVVKAVGVEVQVDLRQPLEPSPPPVVPAKPVSNPFKDDEEEDVIPTTTYSQKPCGFPEQQKKWPAHNGFNNSNNSKNIRQWPTTAESVNPPARNLVTVPPQNIAARNFVAEQPQAAQTSPCVCLHWRFSRTRGFFVHPTMVNNGEQIKHGDWLDFDASYINHKFIVTSYRKKAKPVYPTTTVRNTIQLTLKADVPINFMTQPQDFRIVHTEFVGSVQDDNNWIRPRNVHKQVEIVAVRRFRPENKCPWQILKILREY
uniref:Uncharacterized protein n=1 Tax=Ditylenchus dipsaci TaxID=166011 RepID=A0A915EQ85_9BILA